MWQLTIRNVLARKRRILLTAVAVLLGVAFIGATQILGATVSRSLTTSAGDFYSELAADVRGDEVGNVGDRAPVPADLGSEIAELPGVTAVIDVYVEPVTLVKADGKVLSSPVSAGTWYDSDVQPLTVAEGRSPAAADEVALTDGLSEDAGLVVGDTVRYESGRGPAAATVVGIVTADSESIVGVPALVLAPDAGDLLLPEGQVTELGVLGDGVDLAAIETLAAEYGVGLEVRSGETAAEDAVGDARQAATVLTAAFTAFGALALFVGLFIIYNTFNILMAQRKREMALLRAIGVRRKQVTRSVIGEAAVVGLLSGVLGAALGVLIAVVGRQFLLGDIEGSLVVTPFSLVSGVLTGLLATTTSAWLPARKASAVAPVEALRDASTDTSSTSRSRLIGGIVLAALSAALLVVGLTPDAERRPQSIGVAAFLGLLALIVGLPLIVKPLVAVIGAPVRLLRGHVGTLASENAKRQPNRTASTATALMIGVAIVAFALVLTSSIRASVSSAIEDRVSADFVVAPVTFGTSLSEGAVDATEAAAGDASTAVAWRLSGEVDGKSTTLFAVDTETGAELWDFRPDDAELSDVGADGVLVDRHAAEDKGWQIGDQVEIAFPSGTTSSYRIRAIGDTRPFGTDFLIDSTNVSELDPTAVISQLLVGTGADREQLEAALTDFPNAEVKTPQEMANDLDSALNLLLQVLLGFLGLSVVIAFIGVANTLALSIHERTRELGVLRAIALRRSHVRSAVRWEAAIIAVVGSLLGVVFGAGFGSALSKVLADIGYASVSIPWLQLAGVLVLAALAGAVAAALPARSAAKLDVLDAIHTL